MPFLSDEDREQYRQQTRRVCACCRLVVWMEYCSQCDEFYAINHASSCPIADDQHQGHRRESFKIPNE